jgi:hypothetical protein
MVPALEHLIELVRKFDRIPPFDCAVRQFHQNWGQVRPALLPVPPSVPFQHTAFGRRRRFGSFHNPFELPGFGMLYELGVGG